MKRLLLLLLLVFTCVGCAACSGKGSSEDKSASSNLSSLVSDALDGVSALGSYVDKSRINKDSSNYDCLVSAANVALADMDIFDKIVNKKHVYTITMGTDGVTVACDGITVDATDLVYKMLSDCLGSGFVSSFKKAVDGGADYVITIDSTGVVVKSVSPDVS